MPSHLHRRGAVYYTRLVVPPRLRPIIGKSDLGCSLGVKDLAEAKRLLPIWLIDAQAALAAAEAQLAASDAAPPMNTRLSPEAHWTRAQFVYEEELTAIQLQEASEEADLIEHAEALEQRLKRPDELLTPDERAAAFLVRHLEDQRNDYRRRYKRLKRSQPSETATPLAPLPTSPAVHNTRHTITEMFENYASQSDVTPETAKQFRSIIGHLVTYLGHDEAKRVTHADLVGWRERLRVEPARAGKPRSAKTINDSYLAAVSATFIHGMNALLVGNNPAADVAKIRAGKSMKLRDKDFTNAERKTILKAALVPAGGKLSHERAFARRWVPWLCAYTGARVNEITQLRRQDVEELEGVWVVHITPEAGSVKTNSARTVPLHEHLIDQGFLAAITDKTGPLFYNPANARGGSARGQFKKVGMFLAKWVREDLLITDTAIQPNHAWRHTFKTICLEAGIEERAADYMQGHTSKGQGRRYGTNSVAALADQLAKFPRFVMVT
jgi:integrase